MFSHDILISDQEQTIQGANQTFALAVLSNSGLQA